MDKSISSKTYAQFLEWLKAGRMGRNLTIRDLAELLDEHPSVIGKIEIGERRLDVFEYAQYCAVLELKPMDGLRILQSA